LISAPFRLFKWLGTSTRCARTKTNTSRTCHNKTTAQQSTAMQKAVTRYDIILGKMARAAPFNELAH
jgi:hypothetical protein